MPSILIIPAALIGFNIALKRVGAPFRPWTIGIALADSLVLLTSPVIAPIGWALSIAFIITLVMDLVHYPYLRFSNFFWRWSKLTPMERAVKMVGIALVVLALVGGAIAVQITLRHLGHPPLL